MSKLSQKLLRVLKMKLSFWETEMTREFLTRLRKDTTRREFHAICDDLARDLENYGNPKNQ